MNAIAAKQMFITVPRERERTETKTALESPSHMGPCPMLAALEAQGHLTPDASGKIDLRQLDKAFKDVLGMSLPMRALFQVMAPTSTNIGKLIANVFTRQVDVGHLRGDFFDHRWDSGLLEGGKFHPERFAQLEKFSSDGGKTVTVQEWGKYMRAKLESDRAAGKDVPAGLLGALRDGAFTTFEAGLLSSAVGVRGADGVMRIPLADVRNLYENKKLPDRLQVGTEHKTTVTTMLGGLAQSAFGMIFGNKGAGVAEAGRALADGTGSPKNEAPLYGCFLGLCPVGGKPVAKESGGASGTPTDNTSAVALHEGVKGALPIAKSETSALTVAEGLERAFDKGDAKAALDLLKGRSADDIETLKKTYAQRFARDLEYDMRGFAVDARGPIDKGGFSVTIRGLKGDDLKAGLAALHGPRAEKSAARIAELLRAGPASNAEGRKEIYGMLAQLGGEERTRLDHALRAKTGTSLAQTLAPVFAQHAKESGEQKMPASPDKTVAVVLSSGNWADMLAGKTDKHVGGYHWREIEAYVAEALKNGFTPVFYTPDGLPPSPDALSLLLGKLGPQLGFGMMAGTGPDSPQGKAILEGFLSPRPLSSFKASDVTGLHVAGGHGSFRDLVGNAALEKAAADVHARGGAVTAVCHASSALGKLLAGGPATGFSPQIDQMMLRTGYVLPEFDPPFDAHKALEKVGVPMTLIDRAQSLVNIHHTETIERAGQPPIWTGTGPEATDDVARKAFEWLKSR